MLYHNKRESWPIFMPGQKGKSDPRIRPKLWTNCQITEPMHRLKVLECTRIKNNN